MDTHKQGPDWACVTKDALKGVWQWLKPEALQRSGAGPHKKTGVVGSPPSARMAHTVSALGDNGSEVLVFGGLSDVGRVLSDSFLLNTQTWEWTEVPSDSAQCPEGRAYHTASVISDDRVVMLGGEKRTDETTDTFLHGNGEANHHLQQADVFRLSARSWTTIPILAAKCDKGKVKYPRSRSGHAAEVIKGDRIVIFGGADKSLIDDRYLWILHTSPRESEHWWWERIDLRARLLSRFGHSLTATNENSMLMFGGKNYQEAFDDVTLLSPDFREYERLKTNKESVDIPSLFGHSALNIASQLVVIGGKALNASSHEIYIFDFQNRSWRRQETSINMEGYLPRYYQACCVFGGNKILMFGGYDLSWGSQNDLAILDTGLVTSGLLTDLKHLVRQAPLSDLTLCVHPPSASASASASSSRGGGVVNIAVHRALVAARCPSLLAAAVPESDEVHVDGDPAAWHQFVHFLYTGLFDDEKDEEEEAEGKGDEAVPVAMSKRKLVADQTKLVASLLAINARHPIAGLSTVLNEHTRSLPARNVIHNKTFQPLVDSLHRMLEAVERGTDPLCDITLQLDHGGADEEEDDKKLGFHSRVAVHRFMLVARSEYFRAMLRFEGGGNSSSEASAQASERLLTLSESVSPHSFNVLLTFLYTDRVNLNELDVDQALELIGVANEYLLADLKMFLERFIIRQEAIDDDNALFVLETSDQFGAHELRYHCVGLLAQRATWETDPAFAEQLAALPPHLSAAIRERQELL